MKTISTFGKALAQVMKGRMAFHNVTQAEMASAIGISQSQLSKILRADRTIDLEAFEAFCEALGENAADLISVGERIAKQTKEKAPYSYTPAADLIFVVDGQRLAKPISPSQPDAEPVALANGVQQTSEDIDIDAWADRIKAEDSVKSEQ